MHILAAWVNTVLVEQVHVSTYVCASGLQYSFLGIIITHIQHIVQADINLQYSILNFSLCVPCHECHQTYKICHHDLNREMVRTLQYCLHFHVLYIFDLFNHNGTFFNGIYSYNDCGNHH